VSFSISPLIIVIIVVLAVLGPILTMRPSPRDRQQSGLRQFAYRSGFRVEIIPPAWAEEFRRSELDEPGWMLYWLAWPPTLSRDRRAGLSRLLYWAGDEVPPGNPLPTALPIPAPFSALFVDGRRVGLVWKERGTTAELEPALREFREAVEAWSQA